ncbi:MAG: YdcF family protein [Scytonema sp. PMC 1070.18]|nr:YdcF family protein [Scytonema sp. PMC 1070.18]
MAKLKWTLNLRTVVLTVSAGLVILASIIPLRIAIAFDLAPEPQAILVLGGADYRYEFASRFAQQHPSLDIWISDVPSNVKHNRDIFRRAGVDLNRLRFDVCPTDTVTNFACMTEPLTRENIVHVYLITSDFHMARSRAIATVVFGSRGIVVTPVSVASNELLESKWKIARDVVRSLIWILTGRSGASFNPALRSPLADLLMAIAIKDVWSGCQRLSCW